jgi:ubiquinone/menaquinone biosynthesis C-methylase UbiE
MNKIADYDTLDYDYATYWKGREYENMSEHFVLEKIFNSLKGKWFVDIGGSYGRLTDTYYDRYTNPLIIDYSLKTLQKNYKYLKDKYPNIELIAANAYSLPFAQNTFDGGLMVRVLHHIEKPKEYFKEVYRIFKPNATYIQEFANKLHLKAVLSSILRLNLKIFNNEPYQQPNKKNYEGARKGSSVPFLNYHTSWIVNTLNDTGFVVESKYGCSFLRLNILKNILGTKLLLLLERFFQFAFSWSNISPSIFIKSKIQKDIQNEDVSSSLEDILVCPICKEGMEIKGGKATCKECKKTFKKVQNIWDFRV